MRIRPFSPRGKTQPRIRRGWRPDPIRALEGRALLATSAIDPTFGTGGAVVGSVNSGLTLANSSAVAALTVLGSGQVLTAETQVPSTTSTAGSFTPLVVRRYNSNGTLDTTFGSGGSTAIPFPALPGITTAQAPRNLAIQPDGSILVASTATSSGSSASVSVVARLTKDGQLDSSFGTGGEVSLASTITQANSVVVEGGSGRIVVAGVLDLSDSSGTLTSRTMALVGLSSTGGIDSTFGTTGLVIIPQAAPIATSLPASEKLTLAGLQVSSTGQILLGVRESNLEFQGPANDAFTLTRLSAAGTIDTTFGANGTLNLTSTILANDIVAQPDGRILLAGATNQLIAGGLGVISGGAVVRLLADGTPDPSFTVVPTPTQGERFQRAVVGSDGEITAVSSNSNRVFRYLPSGQPDTSVGVGGRLSFRLPAAPVLGPNQSSYINNDALGLTLDGKILVGASREIDNYGNGVPSSFTRSTQSVLAQVQPIVLRNTPNDYDFDGRSDLAAILPAYSVYASRPSSGLYPDDLITLKYGGAYPNAIPAPGDYDGDGRADQVAYDPTSGAFILNTAHGTGIAIPFGLDGAGNSIPAPGDYDGDGKTDLAVYLPSQGAFEIRPSTGGPDETISFGVTGAGNVIPVPGDYDGDGKTDLAVYLPQIGVLAYRPSSATPGSPDVYVPFGVPGAGNTIPAPGDYDGDGKTDVAAYLPQYGVYAYRSSTGKGDVLQPFGVAGAGRVVPVPGDYDGDGTDDIAVYIPETSAWYYRSSAGRGDVGQIFGAPGAGQTIPATVVVTPTSTVSAMSFAPTTPDPNTGVLVYLPNDLPGATTTPKKPSV